MRKTVTHILLVGMQKWIIHGEINLAISSKISYKEIPLLGIYPKDTLAKIQKDIYMRLFNEHYL